MYSTPNPFLKKSLAERGIKFAKASQRVLSNIKFSKHYIKNKMASDPFDFASHLQHLVTIYLIKYLS